MRKELFRGPRPSLANVCRQEEARWHSTSLSSVTHAGASTIAAYHRKLTIVTVRIYHHGSLDGEITEC